jgi:hypothetical protein
MFIKCDEGDQLHQSEQKAVANKRGTTEDLESGRKELTDANSWTARVERQSRRSVKNRKLG